MDGDNDSLAFETTNPLEELADPTKDAEDKNKSFLCLHHIAFLKRLSLSEIPLPE